LPVALFTLATVGAFAMWVGPDIQRLTSTALDRYLYVLSARFRPAKTDAPLIINSNAVLTCTIAF